METNGFNKYKDFSIYENIGATQERFIKDMSEWAKALEMEGRLPYQWCIMDDKIQVIGNVDLRGLKIKYPFGTVSGLFKCDDEEKSSPNYPVYIAMKSIV